MRRIVTMLSALLGGVALAQGSGAAGVVERCRAAVGVSGEPRVTHAAEWVCVTSQTIEAAGLFNIIDGVAWLVLMAFFVGRVLSISLGPNPGERMRPFLLASFFGFALMLSLTPIRTTMTQMWGGTYSLAAGVSSRIVGESMNTAVEVLRTDVERLVGVTVSADVFRSLADMGDTAVLVGGGGAAAAAGGRSVYSAIRGTLQAGGAAARLSPAFRVFDMVLLPILTLYSMIVYGAALVVILGMLFLPIGAVMFVTGNGAPFFSNWANVMLASLLTLLVFPIMWAIVTQVAVVTPLSTFINEWIEAGDAYQDAMDQIVVDAEGVAWYNVGDQLTVALDAAGARIGAIAGRIGSVISLVFGVIVGVVTGFSLIFLLQRFVMKFIAGVVAAAQGFSPVFGGLLGRAGGGGGKSEAGASKSQQPGSGTTQGAGDTGGGGSGGGGGSPRPISGASGQASGPSRDPSYVFAGDDIPDDPSWLPTQEESDRALGITRGPTGSITPNDLGGPARGDT